MRNRRPRCVGSAATNSAPQRLWEDVPPGHPF